ncbi:MAG: ROK family protein [Nanoarchaeota archaeon]|nr:ROK family protein [Nanoarchaeota archaeon]
MNKYCLALDIGGTNVKSAIISSEGLSVKNSFRNTPINTQSAEGIIGTFIGEIKSGMEISRGLNLELAGMGISIAGPFDNEKGISLMKHKLGAIYGLNLKNEFIKYLELPKDYLIRFEVDSWAFLKGEKWLGSAKGLERIIGVTIGTGLGSGFMADGQIIVEGSGVPQYGWLGGLPYNGGILDNRISKRGIISRYSELAGRDARILDVKEIANLGAEQNDEISLQVFKEAGTILGKILNPIALNFKPDCIIFGGQISKAFSLFEKPLRNELSHVSTLEKVTAGYSIDQSALYGAAQAVFGLPSPNLVNLDETTVREMNALWG